MTLLSRKADYAMLIVSYLHHKPEGGNARTIAERFGLSRPFVANILKELCHRGYVVSHRGVKGGYALKESARAVTLADFLASIDEGFRLTLCNHTADPTDVCSLEASCPVRGPLSDIHRRIVDVLRGVTLADVVAPPPVSPAPAAGLLPLLPPEPACRAGGDHRHQPAIV
ncbi:MAG TPA: Rrf2 family transcriptional regulator [Fimbriiglobus sp.]|nr:Rrf2 family transcriptional regulator [Fimbriiglobus sp.]